MDPVSVTHTGTVKFFDPVKGYGFIENAGLSEDVFVHATIIRDQYATLEVGQRVRFTIAEQNGRLRASTLMLVDPPMPGQIKNELFDGVVKKFSESKGYGLISSIFFTQLVFFNTRFVKDGDGPLQVGDTVYFSVMCDRGRACAIYVERAISAPDTVVT